MTTEKPSVTHVIFDFDGLLVDTEPSYTLANRAMLSKFGKEFTMELKGADEAVEFKSAKMVGYVERKRGVIANGQYDKLQVGIADCITPEEYAIEYDALLANMFRTCNSMPGAERLVRHLAEKGVPMAICTGSCSRTFAQKAEKHRDWIDLIPIHVLSGDDESIRRGKPFPDPFLETMKRFPKPPNSPSHVLVFEDAPNGVKAAQAAGMQCVMVPDLAFHKEAALLCVCNVLPSLELFKPEEFGLPAFD